MYGSDGPGDKLFRIIPSLNRQRAEPVEYDDPMSSSYNPTNHVTSPILPLPPLPLNRLFIHSQ
jgi:hypothetical protein